MIAHPYLNTSRQEVDLFILKLMKHQHQGFSQGPLLSPVLNFVSIVCIFYLKEESQHVMRFSIHEVQNLRWAQ